MNRPYVIIHIHTSIDGNIDVMDLPEFATGSQRKTPASVERGAL